MTGGKAYTSHNKRHAAGFAVGSGADHRAGSPGLGIGDAQSFGCREAGQRGTLGSDGSGFSSLGALAVKRVLAAVEIVHQALTALSSLFTVAMGSLCGGSIL